MESYVQSSEDFITDSLNYKITGNTAEYVSRRRMCSFFASGSDTYSPSSGTKTMRIKLASNNEWLDVSTIRLNAQVNNTGSASANDIHLVSGLHSFISRVRVLIGGQVCEDMVEYARLHEMFLRCSADGAVLSDGVEGVPPYKKQDTSYAGDANAQATELQNLYKIVNGKSRTMSTKILSGILGGNSKMLPLRYCGGVEIELEVVNNANDAVISDTADSASWTITRPEIQCDLITLDSQLENEYANYLLKGSKIPIKYQNIIHTSQVINNANFSVNVARSATRLDSIFLTFSGPFSSSWASLNSRDFNFFWHPSNANGAYVHNDQLSLAIQIGASKFPEKPVSSTAESFYNLRKALGLHNTNQHALDITSKEYASTSFIHAVNCERVFGSDFSGVNSRNELITIEGKPANASTTDSSQNPTRIHVALLCSNILEIGMDGISVFD